ncbi:MAG: LamG domain-containing protein, partial [Thermoanaerobaculia bacterium]|nr:LamG domain-containing protein [Thermoanaerobaculia bacterium]
MAIWADPPLLIGDVAGGMGETALRRLIASKQAPALPTTTTIHVQGTPGAVALVGVGGSEIAEAFTFDAESGGAVPGVVAGHPLVLEGAAISAAQMHMGAASLRLDTGTSARLADAPEFDFGDELELSFWLWPDAISGAGNLVSKPGAWTLEQLGDGTVRATVGSGVTLSTSVALDPEQWNMVSLLIRGGQARLNVNGESVAAAAGPLAATTSDIVVGGGYSGYLDDLALRSAAGGLSLFCLDGVDAAGQVVLDANG